MRTFLVTFLLVAMLSPVTAFAKDFGQGVTLSADTAISSIIDTPADYVGKKVKVSGLVIKSMMRFAAHHILRSKSCVLSWSPFCL